MFTRKGVAAGPLMCQYRDMTRHRAKIHHQNGERKEIGSDTGVLVSQDVVPGAYVVDPGTTPADPSLSLKNNCIIEESPSRSGLYKLSASGKRSKFVLQCEVMAFIKRWGIEHVGFLTLTFADQVVSVQEAQRRFHSLLTNVIAPRYGQGIVVSERQQSGRIHFHLLVYLSADIRTGFDFAAVARQDYRSACQALRDEWSWWREHAGDYNFGRCEMLPVRTSRAQVAHYIGKYLSKHGEYRRDIDRGARLVRYYGYQEAGARTAHCRVGWVTPGAWVWRKRLAAFAARHGFTDTAEIRRAYGSHWCWCLREEIWLTELPAGTRFPTLLHAQLALGDMGFGHEWRRTRAELIESMDRATAAIGSSQPVRQYPINAQDFKAQLTCNSS